MINDTRGGGGWGDKGGWDLGRKKGTEWESGIKWAGIGRKTAFLVPIKEVCNILRRNRGGGGTKRYRKGEVHTPAPPPPPPPPPSTRDKVGCSQPKIPRPGRPPSQVLCNFKVSNSLISHVNLWFQIQYNFAVT